jgi:sulfur relay (sulfurtransferase) complex TusBCD TusD component (DsrE family)
MTGLSFYWPLPAIGNLLHDWHQLLLKQAAQLTLCVPAATPLQKPASP